MSERSPALVSPRHRRVILYVASTVAGAVIAATLLGLAGSLSHNEIPGMIAGAVLGAVIGWGMIKAYIRPFVVWMLVFAAAFAWVGPGFDAPPMVPSLCGAVFGAFMNWRRATILVGAALGAGIGNSFVGLAVGGLIGLLLAQILRDQVSQLRCLLSKRVVVDRPSYASLRRSANDFYGKSD